MPRLTSRHGWRALTAMSEQQQNKARLHREYDRVWGNWPGWGALAAVNHTSVGLRFIVTGLVFFLIGGVLSMLMRTQLALPEQDIIGPELYNQLFTMHGDRKSTRLNSSHVRIS